MKDVEKKLQRARIELLLTQPFFGTLSLFLNLEATEWCGTAATDGKTMYYAPDFIEKLSEEECVFLVGHEVLHCALGHLWRRGHRNKEKWNLAIDFAANEILVKSGFTLPKNGAYDKHYADLPAESIYELLPPFTPKRRYDTHLEKGDLLPDGVYDAPSVEESAWNLRVKSVLEILKSQGKEPLGVVREIGDLSKAVIDWRNFLSSFFARLARNDYTWLPPNKKYLNMGFILPVIRSFKMDIVVALDTSGSISNRDLAVFTTELYEIAATMPVQLTLMACDAAVHEVVTYQPYESPHVPAVSGNGGTDFRPVFDRIEEENLSPSCLIYFTDGCGTYPFAEPDYPVVWVLKGTNAKHPAGPPQPAGMGLPRPVTPWGIELYIET